ncbi:hypothetical protein S2091_1036 [Solimicrobium silvestre]|uniref:Uncharacterized protein n=2 Tax=Solimicrobium silvestre TaxID=2099400 RepID=A0A2S9H354_9BURK|nr:hypothetical protein S2091_1036 [Solimicrobium silvestre]
MGLMMNVSANSDVMIAGVEVEIVPYLRVRATDELKKSIHREIKNQIKLGPLMSVYFAV